MFAAITVALAVGAVAERGRMLPTVVFMFVWSTIIYDPIACWTWNPSGWVFRMGGLDFAGGTPVHISSGCAALAYSIMLGKRRGHGTHELNYRPHNVTHIVIGTVFLWVGWFGFNAGSALGANLRAVMAAVVTNLAAGVGGMTWCVLDYRLERKWSTVGFCSGVIAGLVAVTPGSGFVPAWAAVIYGVCGAAGANLGYQIADSVAGAAYSFFGTCIILCVMNLIPGLSLRASEEAEILGIDDAEIGEFAYDYVELTREVLNDTDDAVSKYSPTRDSHTEKILRRVSDDRLDAMDQI
ncbi:ammonium transporter [Diplocarpon rosae]|nr:ammonium transporter [Diplocarpon rosae]